MPKEPHSKFVVSADPYPSIIDTSKSQMIYQPPDAAPDADNRNERMADEEQDWELYLDSIIETNDPDLNFNVSLPLVHSQIEFDYPDFFEYHTALNAELDYEQGIKPDMESQDVTIRKLFEHDSDKDDSDNDGSTDSTQGPAYSELLEDDWDVGILRKEHSPEFQAEAGLDFGDEKLGEADDDEGDVWNLE